VLADVVVTVVVLNSALARRGGIAGVLGRACVELPPFPPTVERETKEYLASSWSGDASSLPAWSKPLLEKLGSDPRARGGRGPETLSGSSRHRRGGRARPRARRREAMRRVA